MATILLINGPNLNLLGSRETHKYGKETLPSIESRLGKIAADSGHKLITFQSNSEGALIDRIQQSTQAVDFIIINPGAYTHTSIALRDALLAVSIPFIECHLSNIYQREKFRQSSFFSDISNGVILGFGPLGYELALNAAMHSLDTNI